MSAYPSPRPWYSQQVGIFDMSRTESRTNRLKTPAALLGASAVIAMGVIGLTTGGVSDGQTAVVSGGPMSTGHTADVDVFGHYRVSQERPAGKGHVLRRRIAPAGVRHGLISSVATYAAANWRGRVAPSGSSPRNQGVGSKTLPALASVDSDVNATARRNGPTTASKTSGST